jgi:hypothetical protein
VKQKQSGKRSLLEYVLGAAPALLGLLFLGFAVVTSDKVTKLGDLFPNPLSAGLFAVYGSVVLGMVTLIIWQLVRSAPKEELDTRKSKQQPESAPSRPNAEEAAAIEAELSISGPRRAFTRTRNRMNAEIERVKRSSYLNLAIGILFSIIALGILGYPLSSSHPAESKSFLELFERFAPRFSVGILIQIIGFFFLRLYVAGENEVHYIRNELTNLESRLIAYQVAAMSKDMIAMGYILKQFVRTERNFILKKNERTLYGVDEKYNDIREVLKDILGAIRTTSKKV